MESLSVVQSGVHVTELLDQQLVPHEKSQRAAVTCHPDGQPEPHCVNVPASSSQVTALPEWQLVPQLESQRRART